jgi:hypothetical protein
VDHEEIAGLPVDAAVRKISEGGATTVQDRLARRFGYGDQPTKRRILYDRIAACIEKHGGQAEMLVGEAVVQAEACHGRKDRYFCHAVVLKLREARLWASPQF